VDRTRKSGGVEDANYALKEGGMKLLLHAKEEQGKKNVSTSIDKSNIITHIHIYIHTYHVRATWPCLLGGL
jgi:hypothetical protein